jgi:hypothetical protein
LRMRSDQQGTTKDNAVNNSFHSIYAFNIVIMFKRLQYSIHKQKGLDKNPGHFKDTIYL